MKALSFLTFLIAVGALALGYAAYTKPPPPPAPPAPTMRQIAETQFSDPPEKIDGVVGTCNGGPDAVNLKDLMTSSLNPCMTRLSTTLFHPEADPTIKSEGDRLATAAGNATNMLECIHNAAHFTPKNVKVDRLPDYYRFLESLQSDTLALQTAALEGRSGEVDHWFVHVRQDCIACHKRFSFDDKTQGAQDAAATPPPPSTP